MVPTYVMLRMPNMPQPAYCVRMISEPVLVLSHTEDNVTYLLYVCKVVHPIGRYPMNAYLSTWSMFTDTLELQYWDTKQIIEDVWFNLLGIEVTEPQID